MILSTLPFERLVPELEGPERFCLMDAASNSRRGEFFAADYTDYADSGRKKIECLCPLLNPRNPCNPRLFLFHGIGVAVCSESVEGAFVQAECGGAPEDGVLGDKLAGGVQFDGGIAAHFPGVLRAGGRLG